MFQNTTLIWLGFLAYLPFSLRFHPRDLNAPLADCYDYIIVGGGLSGLVIANRLTEDPDEVTVLVLEAGDLDDYEDIILSPMENGQGLGSKYDWNLWTAPQTHLDGAPRPYDLGRGVGGGSLINGMCWTRGGRADFDAWVELGNPGWGWDDLLPYFKKSERYTVNVDADHRRDLHIAPDPTIHGTEGSIHVSYPRYFFNQSQLFLEGLQELGIPILTEPNNGTTTGSMLIPNSMSPDNQTRSSARLGYFDGIVDSRPNFHIATGQHVTRLLSPKPSKITPRDYPDGVWFSGVEFVSDGSMFVRNVTCKREVILAAGNVHTPQLLELSGIGMPEILKRYNIPILLDLPGVGNNFQDHPYVGVVYYYNNASYFNINKQYYDPVLYADLAREYTTNKTGPWTSGTVINTVAFPSLRSISKNWTDMVVDATKQSVTQHLLPNQDSTIIAGYEAQKKILVNFLGRADVSAYEILNNNFGLMSVATMHAFSRGSVHIQSTNPLIQPLIDPRYCSNPLDCQVLVEALLFNNKIVQTKAIKLLDPAPYYPFLQDATPETLMPAINSGLRTEFHGTGTTSMMPREKGGVVDTHLRVYGTRNLRIVDAGIMPLIPASHLQAPMYAVAEKAADIIKADNAGTVANGCGTDPTFATPGSVRLEISTGMEMSTFSIKVFPESPNTLVSQSSIVANPSSTFTESSTPIAPASTPPSVSVSSSSTFDSISPTGNVPPPLKAPIFPVETIPSNNSRSALALSSKAASQTRAKPSTFAQVLNISEWSGLNFTRQARPSISRFSFAPGAAPADAPTTIKIDAILQVASLFSGLTGTPTLRPSATVGALTNSQGSSLSTTRFRLEDSETPTATATIAAGFPRLSTRIVRNAAGVPVKTEALASLPSLDV